MYKIAVIGCGIFGAEVALAGVASGLNVTVFEALPDILSGASHNNQNRLHLGFHYPRDLDTGRQSIRGFKKFIDRYPECIASDFVNGYFVSSSDSKTSPKDFISFCERLGASFRQIDPALFPVQVHGVSTAIICSEVVYDSNLLRSIVRQRLRDAGVDIRTSSVVSSLTETQSCITVQLDDTSSIPFDAVVNCSYANINRLTKQLGYLIADQEYEYTVVPIISWAGPKVGLTIMDGPFMTVLPFGKSNEYLLYAVEGSVVARQTCELLPEEWLNPLTAPLANMDRAAHFEAMISSCARFVPSLSSAKVTGYLEGPRMVLARNDATDARPSLINSYSDRYVTVYSGKVDHSIWVAETVAEILVGTRASTETVVSSV